MRARYLLPVALMTLFLPGRLRAAEIRKINLRSQVVLVVYGADQPPAEAPTHVCLTRDDERLACGSVIKSNRKGLVLRATNASGLEPGTKVSVVPATLSEIASQQTARREPASAATELEISGKSTPIAFGAGLQTFQSGKLWLFPTLVMEYAVSPIHTLGVSAGFTTSTGRAMSYNAYSFLLTGNYYTSQIYRGWWAQLGLGPYLSSTESPDGPAHGFAMSLLATFGHRFGWKIEETTIALGIRGGGQLFTNLHKLAALPTLLIDVSATF